MLLILRQYAAASNLASCLTFSRYKRCLSVITSVNCRSTPKDELASNELMGADGESTSHSDAAVQGTLGGFAKAYDSHTDTLKEASTPKPPSNEGFATLLRQSRFIDVSAIIWSLVLFLIILFPNCGIC